MPIYEYVCEECKSRFERIVTAKNGKTECPKCGSRRSAIQFSTFAAHTSSGAPASESSHESQGVSPCGCTPHSCGCN